MAISEKSLCKYKQYNSNPKCNLVCVYNLNAPSHNISPDENNSRKTSIEVPIFISRKYRTKIMR